MGFNNKDVASVSALPRINWQVPLLSLEGLVHITKSAIYASHRRVAR